MLDTNALGERGEAIFFVTATKFHGEKPLFHPASLGAKWPVADYAVELVDSPGKFFLVQVKATQAVVSASRRIRVSASEDHVRLLLAAPVPTFIAAVDEPNERVFIVRPKKAQRLQSIGTSFLLNDPAVRVKLRDEVASFWNAVSPIMAQYQSAFLDK